MYVGKPGTKVYYSLGILEEGVKELNLCKGYRIKEEVIRKEVMFQKERNSDIRLASQNS